MLSSRIISAKPKEQSKKTLKDFISSQNMTLPPHFEHNMNFP